MKWTQAQIETECTDVFVDMLVKAINLSQMKK